MSLQKRFSQLGGLSGLQPDKNWENKTRYEILAEISSQNKLMQAQKLSSGEKADLAVMSFFRSSLFLKCSTRRDTAITG